MSDPKIERIVAGWEVRPGADRCAGKLASVILCDTGNVLVTWPDGRMVNISPQTVANV